MRFALVLLCACASSDAWVEKIATTTNTLCAFAPNPTADQVMDTMRGTKPATMGYLPNNGLHLVVEYGCFSSSCDRQQRMICTISKNGRTVSVATTVTWEQKDGDGLCTLACGFVQGSCDTGPLDPGVNTIVVDDRRLDIPLTGEQTVPCTRL